MTRPEVCSRFWLLTEAAETLQGRSPEWQEGWIDALVIWLNVGLDDTSRQEFLNKCLRGNAQSIQYLEGFRQLQAELEAAFLQEEGSRES